MAGVAAGPWGDASARTWAWGWRAGAGAVLAALGGLGSLAALASLGRNLSVLPHPKDGAALVATGAYAWVRHPIYVGVLALGAGWALLWGSWAAALAWAALFVLFDLKARREEHLLAQRFPGYGDYLRRVRRFIPGVY